MPPTKVAPDPDAIAQIGELLSQSDRPVIVIGSDVWADGADEAALRLVEGIGIPAITNGMGRGIIPGGHPLLMTKARGLALGQCDLTIVIGTPLDFRLGYGVLRRQGGRVRARVVHLADSEAGSPGTRPSPARRTAT